MTTRDEIKTWLIEMVREQFDADDVDEQTNFIGDLGADSLDTLEMVMEAEEYFEIRINDEDVERIATVGQASDFLYKMLNR